ncbi:DUF2933 domain-containing protein [Gellertiella hungarica]|uniref:DUF2933 domain-containing protein n=1 Tax=Gellertiella hungarica TaxID=1572859 RepID=A0A7W6NNA0_9HYPH|nr:DUF2933 domain-containing protein [Gellertiella hungarica]MBB4067255.1 hypothetical protein [Gellertiella hungarica]
MITSRTWVLMAISFGVIAAFFVLREHWTHVLGLAPYLLLMACPLMHLFHGHSGHEGHHHHDREDRKP